MARARTGAEEKLKLVENKTESNLERGGEAK